MSRIVLFVLTWLLCYVGWAEPQQAIFLVRHGDTVRQKGNPDVPLAEPGERRAQALAALLRDSGINVIYTTGLQRTVKTAEPLAKQLGIESKLRPQLRPGSKSDDADEFARFCAWSTAKISCSLCCTPTASRHFSKLWDTQLQSKYPNPNSTTSL